MYYNPEQPLPSALEETPLNPKGMQVGMDTSTLQLLKSWLQGKQKQKQHFVNSKKGKKKKKAA